MKKKKIIILAVLALSALALPQNVLKLQNDAAKITGQSKVLTIENIPNAAGKKNAGLAIIYSLLLPGMGELYGGNYSSGKYFTAAEGLLWISYIGMNTYAGWKKDDYKSLAVKNAGVTPDGKDDKFYATIGEYPSVDNYNNIKTLEYNFAEMYDANKYYWNWQSNNDRKNYRNLWVKSEQAYNDLRFIVGGMIINRIISAINAARIVSLYNKNLDTNLSWNISTSISQTPIFSQQINFNFQTTF